MPTHHFVCINSVHFFIINLYFVFWNFLESPTPQYFQSAVGRVWGVKTCCYRGPTAYVYQIITSHPLNLDNAICQLSLSKGERKKVPGKEANPVFQKESFHQMTANES